MALGLSHSLSRHTLKFSIDKIDTMIVQAINLLDDIDKEVNNYAMRLKEWYSWHFPELGKIISDNVIYAKVVKKIGIKTNIRNSDLSDIIPTELEQELKESQEISMGTEIT
jgi:nucleolar protein 58|mmetsp:Transcript_10630/g.1602  ORF Transcript_10630/g.1602 Transcript_10630/m.1602 type:complete len:111 (+) Transcript_10630:414-746(+)